MPGHESETATQILEKIETVFESLNRNSRVPLFMSRVYSGRFGVKDAYRGKKSINLRLEKSQALLLGIALMNAFLKGGEILDIAIYDFRRQEKAGKIPAGTHPSTVTFVARR